MDTSASAAAASGAGQHGPQPQTKVTSSLGKEEAPESRSRADPGAADGAGRQQPPAASASASGTASPPPPSVSHLTQALREVASEPGATLHYPAAEGEHPSHGPPGVPLTPANPAADPAAHNIIVAPGPSPRQVDVVEEVDLPPLAPVDGSTPPVPAAVLEQVCEPRPAIGPQPLHDPLAVLGSSDESEGPDGGADGEGAAAEAAGADMGGGAVDALTAATTAMGLGSLYDDEGDKEEKRGAEEAGGGGHHSGGAAGKAMAVAGEALSGGRSHLVGSVACKLRQSAAGVADAVRSSAGQVDQAARGLATAVAAVAAVAKDKALGGDGGSKAAELLGESLVGDLTVGGGGGDGGGRDQGDVAEDWTAGPAP